MFIHMVLYMNLNKQIMLVGWILLHSKLCR